VTQPKVKVEIPSFQAAKELSVELRVTGPNAETLLKAMGVRPEDMQVTKSVEGPTIQATVHPFGSMTAAEYTKWTLHLLRKKLSDHWWCRW